ncbi:MAG: hypothetical protein AB7P03_23385 [Kofleriaceae bacterium]
MSLVRFTLLALVVAAGCKKPESAGANSGSGSGSAPAVAEPTGAPGSGAAPGLNPADPDPPAGACEGVATHIAGLITVLPIKDDKEPSHLEFFRKRMTSSLTAACEADKWNEPMRTCLLAMKDLDGSSLAKCQDSAALEAHKQRTADARSDYARRVLIVKALGTPNAPLDPVPVAECSSYIDVVNAWFQCDKTPLQGRAMMLSELEKIEPSFATGDKADAKALGARCNKLEQAVRKSLAEMGC